MPLVAFEFLVDPVAAVSHPEGDSGLASLRGGGGRRVAGDSFLELVKRSGGLHNCGTRRGSLAGVTSMEESESTDELVGLAGQFLGRRSHLFGG